MESVAQPSKVGIVEDREPIELPVERIPRFDSVESEPPFVVQLQFGGFNGPPPTRGRSEYGAPRPRRFWPVVLFLLTCFSTFWVGGGLYLDQFLSTLREPASFEMLLKAFAIGGLKYSVGVMSILFAHEMGHYLQARRYGVPASWPWFIPMPLPPLGTMGAVIVQASGYADRKQTFDIGISGPLAGLVIALPITILGLRESSVIDMQTQGGGDFSFGNPLILQWLAELRFGPLGPHEDIVLNPWLQAGWVGIFVTALNLIPIGQLDGGHILYCLIGRKAHSVARFLLYSAMAWMFLTRNFSYWLILLLMFMTGVRHPPTRDDSVPLGPFRVLLGWLTLAFVLVGFTSRPIHIDDRPLPPQEDKRPQPTFVMNEHS